MFGYGAVFRLVSGDIPICPPIVTFKRLAHLTTIGLIAESYTETYKRHPK